MDGWCAQVRTIEIMEESDLTANNCIGLVMLWRELRRLVSSIELLRSIAVEVDD